MAKHCANCGHELREGDTLCARCGTLVGRQEHPAEPVRWQHCEIVGEQFPLLWQKDTFAVHIRGPKGVHQIADEIADHLVADGWEPVPEAGPSRRVFKRRKP